VVGDRLLVAGEEEQGSELLRGSGEGEERKGKEGRERVAAEGGRKESRCTGREAAEGAAVGREEGEEMKGGGSEERERSEAVVADLPSVVDGRSEEEERGIERSRVGVGEMKEPSEECYWRRKGVGGKEKLEGRRRWAGGRRGNGEGQRRVEKGTREQEDGKEERTFEL